MSFGILVVAAADFLSLMAQTSRDRARQAEATCSRESLLAWIAAQSAPPRLSLSPQGFDLIAEVKLRSPAAGLLRDRTTENVATRAALYSEAGAAAISILTEPSRFDGEMDHLRQGVIALDTIPAMRKDFLVNEYQVLEARAAGAGGVLLIVRMLSADTLQKMVHTALNHDLFVLLEVFDRDDIDVVKALLQLIGPSRCWTQGSPRLLVGVNSRDLVSLQVVPERLVALVDELPDFIPKVAESGLETAEHAATFATAGYDLALVGSALMRAATPAELVRSMLEAGRRAKGDSQ